ncbi:class I adenylate-forming enzyme family protein [Nocardioides sp.]|uniref:class I adenylate-forming enzyme family protein n=1 Tax=Nocardioides sp. TaxID=35761 RepID=UPI003D0E9311
MNVVEGLWDRAGRQPDAPALTVGDRTWTYAELVTSASVIATRLIVSGVRPGDRVLIVLPTSAEFVVMYHSVLAAGAIAVTVNTMSTREEIDYFIKDSGCVLAVGWHEAPGPVTAATSARAVPLWIPDPVTRPLSGMGFVPIVRGDDDVAVLLYTSGTTGRPKGAQLTHVNLRECADAVAAGLELGGDERFGTALPLFHVYGQAVVMGTAFRCGALLCLLPVFDAPRLLRMACEEGLTLLAGVPTMWNDMLDAETGLERTDFHHLRIALSGGAALPLEVARALRDRFGCTLLEGYGLSEATGVATMNSPDGVRKQGSVGRPLPGLRVRVVDSDGSPALTGDVGEVEISGPVLMRGYWGRPEATAEVMHGEWLRTGDLGRQDAEGFLWIVDRKKDLVIRGGYNVYPREIEELLYEHPAVREAAVIGVPDRRLGEEVAALIVFRQGHSVGVDELRGWLDERLSAYKTPRIFLQVDVLPKGTTGKIIKREIDRERVLATGTRTVRAAR